MDLLDLQELRELTMEELVKLDAEEEEDIEEWPRPKAFYLVNGYIQNNRVVLRGKLYRPVRGDASHLDGLTMLFGVYLDAADPEDGWQPPAGLVYLWGTPAMRGRKPEWWHPDDLALLCDEEGVRLGFWRQVDLVG